ncbi:SIMPL domain-containing protein [Flavobacterium sp.]|uniref:SIMPL domain-containing protein n=1 Tax=Flavobacterium sp. TaxID=239 RepID=UPI002612777F|nr:SIMPL domain-containing protein [Flavobacterium sp.]
MKSKIVWVLLLISSFGWSQIESKPIIYVTGLGKVRVVPDQVELTFAVETSGSKANEVQKSNMQKVDAVLKYLTSQGISSNDIQTERVYLNDQFLFERKKSNYVARQQITVLLKKIDSYDKIVEGLTEKGVNAIDNVQLKSSVAEQKKSEARKLAVESAKKKAAELAAASEVKLGKVFNITDMSSDYVPTQFTKQIYAMAENSMADATQSLAAGEMEIIVNIQATYLIEY